MIIYYLNLINYVPKSINLSIKSTIRVDQCKESTVSVRPQQLILTYGAIINVACMLKIPYWLQRFTIDWMETIELKQMLQ